MTEKLVRDFFLYLGIEHFEHNGQTKQKQTSHKHSQKTQRNENEKFIHRPEQNSDGLIKCFAGHALAFLRHTKILFDKLIQTNMIRLIYVMVTTLKNQKFHLKMVA